MTGIVNSIGARSGIIETTVGTPAIVQLVQVTATAVDSGAKTTLTSVCETASGGITLKSSSNTVFVLCFVNRYYITKGTEGRGVIELWEGALAGPVAKMSGISNIGTDADSSNQSVTLIGADTSPASTTPQYSIRIAREGGNTTSVAIIDTPIFWLAEVKA
tara:strand:+ start:47 stop:529 length:483 start_codon:yes stop_codon:yes gene_type:complete